MRSRRESFTLGVEMKRFAAIAAFGVWLMAAALAPAQTVKLPPVSGPAAAAVRALFPPSPIEQVREQAMRQYPTPPAPAPPDEQWVPEQRTYSTELGRVVIIPGHYERRITDQQYAVPPLPAYDVNSGMTFTLPGGQRLPAELRPGP